MRRDRAPLRRPQRSLSRLGRYARKLLSPLPLMALPLLSLPLAGCDRDKPPTVLQTVPLTPPIHPGDAFYPTETCALSEAKALRPLPADTALVTVIKDARAWLDRAGMTSLLQKGDKPYDRALAALTQRALGLPLATLDALRGAGLDPDQPLGLAYLQDRNGIFISFIAVKDGEALTRTLKRYSKKRKATLKSKQEGSATMLRIKGDDIPTRLIVLRDGYAYFVGRGHSFKRKSVERVAKELAQTTAEQGLTGSDGFKRAVPELRFGELMASYVTPTFWYAEEISHHQQNLKWAKERLERYQKRLAKLKAPKKNVKDKDILAESFRAHIRHSEKEIASANKRLKVIEATSTIFPGIAVGLEVRPTGLRYKVFAALGTDNELGIDTKPATDTSLAANAEQPAAGKPTTALPWTHMQPEALHIHAHIPPASLDVGIDEAAHRVHLSRPEMFFKAHEIDRSEWTKHLTGELMLLAPPPSPRRLDVRTGVLALRLRDAKAAQDAWQKAIVSEKAAELMEKGPLVQDKETGLWRHRGYNLTLGFVRDWAVIGYDAEAVVTQVKALEEAKNQSWLSLIPEPTVATLSAFEGNSMAFLHIPTKQLIAPPKIHNRSGVLRSAEEFGMIGLLNSGAFSHSFGSGMFLGELSKKGKRLQKRIDKTRAKLESLRRRQRIARESGRKRMFTALGNSLLWVRPSNGGVAGYGAQLFGEPNIADVLETGTWLLIDSSDESDTAREIAKLERKLEGLEKAFDKMDRKDKFDETSGFDGILGSGFDDIPELTIGKGAGGLGLRGIGSGGGGRGEGIGLGSVGTIGHGAGTGSGRLGRKRDRSGDDSNQPRRKRR